MNIQVPLETPSNVILQLLKCIYYISSLAFARAGSIRWLYLFHNTAEEDTNGEIRSKLKREHVSRPSTLTIADGELVGAMEMGGPGADDGEFVGGLDMGGFVSPPSNDLRGKRLPHELSAVHPSTAFFPLKLH